jgi:acyl-CoA thioesterase I
MAPPWLLACAVAGAAAIACNTNTPTTPQRTDPPKVVVLGDSLTAGPGLRDDEKMPARLQEHVRAAGLPHVVVNAGVSGDTTADALARLDRALVPGTTVLVVALGANDGLRGVPITTIRRNLETIIKRAQERQLKVLLCGMETLPNPGFDYALDFHRIYPDLANQYKLPLMPFLLLDVVGRPELNLQDGWHPNAAGARIIARNMWAYLEPLLR